MCFNNIWNIPFLVKYVYKWIFFFLKYWKTIPLLYCLPTCMDPRIKVEGVENILNFIAICMNQPSEPDGKIYEQLNNFYKYYENKYGSVS